MANNENQNIYYTHYKEGSYGFNTFPSEEIYDEKYVVLSSAKQASKLQNLYSPQHNGEAYLASLQKRLDKLYKAARTNEISFLGWEEMDDQQLIYKFTSMFNLQQLILKDKGKSYDKISNKSRWYERYITKVGPNGKDVKEIIKSALEATKKYYDDHNGFINIKEVFEAKLGEKFLEVVNDIAGETANPDNIPFEDIALLLPSMIIQGSHLVKALEDPKEFKQLFVKGGLMRTTKGKQRVRPFKLVQRRGKDDEGRIQGAVNELANILIVDNLKKIVPDAIIESYTATGTKKRPLVDLGFVDKVLDFETNTPTNYQNPDFVDQKADGTIVITKQFPRGMAQKYVLEISNKFRSFRDDVMYHDVDLQGSNGSSFYTAIPQLTNISIENGAKALRDMLSFWLPNASSGAIFEKYQDKLLKIVRALTSAFLFDNMDTLLDTGSRKIMLFQINKEVVPASILIARIQNAIENDDLIKTSIKYPNAEDIYKRMLQQPETNGMHRGEERANLLRNTVFTTGRIRARILKNRWDALIEKCRVRMKTP